MIRSLEKTDIPNCLEIYNYYILNSCFTLEEELLNIEEFTKRCLSISKKYPFIVYVNDEKDVIGYAYLNVFNPRSAYRFTADLSIYVSKEHIHEHIGALLFEKIIQLAREIGLKNIISIVTSENPNSLKFHMSNGFILEGTLHNVAFKMNKNIDVYYLRKQID